MLFDVAAHKLLSAAALALRGEDAGAPSDEFVAAAEAAEDALALSADDLGVASEAALDASAVRKGRLAVVYQMNHALAQVDDANLERKEVGERRETYRTDRLPLHPTAASLAAAVRALLTPEASEPEPTFEPVRSFR